MSVRQIRLPIILIAEGLAHSVERLTAEREDAVSTPGAGLILRV